jgi:hypothetical protein
LLVKLVEHVFEENLDIELPLNSIDKIDLVKIALLMEPSVGSR